MLAAELGQPHQVVGGIGMKPPSPCTGSSTTQATLRVDLALNICFRPAIASSVVTPRYGFGTGAR